MTDTHMLMFLLLLSKLHSICLWHGFVGVYTESLGIFSVMQGGFSFWGDVGQTFEDSPRFESALSCLRFAGDCLL